MTDPTEAIRKALKTYDDLLAAGEAMPVAFNESGLIKFLHVFSIRALLADLVRAQGALERVQRILRSTPYHVDKDELFAVVDAALRAGEQKEPK